MDYFNKLELIEDIFNEKINFEKHLSSVSMDALIKDINKNHEYLPLQGSFYVTNDALEEKNWKELDKKIKDELNSVFIKFKNLSNINETILEQLLEYKKKYPNIPSIYNYIINTYTILKDVPKKYETILETVNKFPDYIFGKVALAEHYRINNMHKNIPQVFDNKLDIFLFAPRKNSTYHLSEIKAFYLIIGEYYLLEHKISHALMCYLFLKEFEEEKSKEHIFNFGKEIVIHELNELTNQFKKNVKIPQKKKTVKNKKMK